MNNNSSMMNTILLIVVLIILVGGAIWWYTNYGTAPQQPAQQTSGLQVNVGQTQQPAQQ